ncbi:MAG: histidinol-phosphate aminotransferase family protein [Xanthobacteraceae bacterium]|nr:histidinol-phosphate aminotransferase family protein [Xanthobacteraceae bacterium]
MVSVKNVALIQNEPYTPGLSREYVAQKFGIALNEIAKLGSAENPLGPSPKAAAAVEKARAKIDLYPDWTSQALRAAIATKYGFDPECVVCGAGETEVISSIIRTYAQAGDPVLMYEPCFPIYHMFAENEGRVPVYVPMGADFSFVIDKYIAKLKEAGPKIAFLTNPHSPTGRFMEERDIRAICEATGKETLIVLDEAYIHFTQTQGSMHLLREFSNLIALRTFSKAFGLAGLRLGFGIAANKDLITPLLNIKPTWNLGHMQVEGGIAAIADDEHVNKTVDMIVEMRAYVTKQMFGLNRVRMVPGSRSNFFLIELTDPRLDSTAAFEELLKRGVIVKDGSVSFRGLGKRYLRCDVSQKVHMDRLVRALKEIDANGAG